jgi:hypothetical protein
MNNPKVTAAMSGVVALFLAYSIFGADEQPSSTLSMMNWFFLILAVIACVGSLYKIAKGE